MAATSPPLQADHTDEECFSKLVDGDNGAGQTDTEPENVIRALSNFTLGEVDDFGSTSELNGLKDNQSLIFSEALKNDASIEEQSEVFIKGATFGAKAPSFKEIQWSAFIVDSHQFGHGDFDSDLFLGSGCDSLVNSNAFSESKSALIENTAKSTSSHVGSYEQKYAQIYRPISEQNADLTETKNLENLYLGRKYDTITGQCYQLDGYNATTHIQSDNFSITNANTHESSEGKVQNEFEEIVVSERSDAVNLQQAGHPVLETISEECIILKNRNSVSQDSTDYPSTMVFDPQYPEWYYDTIAQMWCTLESYNHTLHDASNAAQDPLTTNANALAKGSVLEISDAVNLQQYGHPCLETISEKSCVLNSRNQYPPNMVFDPQFPECYYDTITQMWYTLDSYNHSLHDASNVTQGQLVTNVNALEKVQKDFEVPVLEVSDAVDLQQNSQPVLETISEESSVFNRRNQALQDSIYYPSNMVFDPQYPEWYYDTITQMWYTLESYNRTIHSASNATQVLFTNNVNALSGLSMDDHHFLHGSYAQSGQHPMLEQSSPKNYLNASASGFGRQSIWQEKNGHEGHWNASDCEHGLPSMWQEKKIKESHSKSSGNYDQQKMWQPELLAKNGDVTTFLNNQLTGSFNDSLEYPGSHSDMQLDPIILEPTVKHHYGRNNMTAAWGNVTSESMHHVNQPNMEQSLPVYVSNSIDGTESSRNYTQQSFQVANPSYSQFSYNPNEGRSTAGRPPHALVTFGFGGKVIFMKDTSFSSSSYLSGSQGTVGGVVLIHSLLDVVMTKADFVNTYTAGCFGYFHTLCQESFPGPLVGGNAASKDVNKWIDERVTSSESLNMDSQNGLLLRLLLSLLKILCQHYGKLRSPYGMEPSHEGSDGPESAVSKLFASAKRNDTPFSFGDGSFMHCMKSLPSEVNIRDTASEVQNLLVSGRRKEALQLAQEGQFWGTAVVLASQLGEQFYVDTVKKMAHRQFICGSPLRTLYLLIAGQPADVFSADSSSSGSSGTANRPCQSSEVLPNGLLDGWQENLAIIASNRTKDDELVIIHLGDCLWKERGEVTAAHACYLLAEVNFEPYSDSARLCLLGADHWKNTRTYVCPDSIQRTEIYEYSKVIGNSQFVLLPFQPYKIIYAYMLAEVGKVSDSLRYCQASMKILKNSGRSREVELWRALLLSLEERLRIYQQGGYGTNLAPTKLVNKLFSSIDRSIHRMIGVPPLQPMLQNSGDGGDHNSLVQKVSSSQSAMAISSLMPSPSVEAISGWTADNSNAVHNRSISEPDFGRSTKRSSSKDRGSYGQGSASLSSGPSRFGRFGSQLIQKTIGWVSWSRRDHQAKLGESNKFYYDEKLKRWVEEGAEPPAAEASLPPPPTVASFHNDKSNYDVNNALKNSLLDPKQVTKFDTPSEQGLGLLSVPQSQNQFSARSRGGIRSRYVDTFNKGGGSFTSTFQSSSVPSVKPSSCANFFIPSAPANHGDQTIDASARASTHETTITELPSTSAVQESTYFLSTPSMQRFPSMDSITETPSGKGSLSQARASSWSGAYPDNINTKAVGMETHSFVVSSVASTSAPQIGSSHIQSSSSSSLQLDAGGGSVLDDLHEVEL